MAPEKSNLLPALKPSGFFALRTALLPFGTLTAWVDGVSLAGLDLHGESSATLVARRAELVRRLRKIVTRPEVREAIFLASPSTEDELERWIKTDNANPKLERTLTRYVQRMAGRATPFGLFAGCTSGRLGEKTNLEIGSRQGYRRNARFDNEHLAGLAVSLERREGIRSSLLYRPNSSLYKSGGRWRYVQTAVRNGRRTHALVALDGDEFLDAAVARAEQGATLRELAEAVIARDCEGTIERAEAEQFILELCARDVIVSDLSPVVTGPEPLRELLCNLERACPQEGVIDHLRELEKQLDLLNVQPIGGELSVYEPLADAAAELGLKGPISKMLQVDLLKPASRAECGPLVVGVISDAVLVLHRIAQPPGLWESLKRFRDAFTSRYERREVPLFEVLDEESGIGFDRQGGDPVPLVDGLPFRESDGSRNVWTARDSFLLRRLPQVYKENGRILELSAADVDSLATGPLLPVPDGISVMASVAMANVGSEMECTALIRHVSGPSGMNILGRFCRMDPSLESDVLRHIEVEESARPDAVFAEIVHLPEGRLANILGRPVLRRFEINYLGRSGAPLDKQIPISDLLVSIRDERIVLRSARLDKEVIPRMTTMHNFSRGQGVYRFLCSLQHQGTVGWLSWAWGALESSPFLPRVIHGRCVLARARWWLDQPLLEGFGRGSLPEQIARINRWRKEWGVPRHVALVDSDNELPVDFENVLSVETFLHLVKRRDQAVVFEMFPGPDSLAAYGPEGRFVHEIVVPFVAKGTMHAFRGVAISRTPKTETRRSFPPGDDWLYLKLYAGTSTVDRLLVEALYPVIRQLQNDGLIRRWFFLRYADPDWHLRLRINGDPRVLQTEVFPVLRRSLQAELQDRQVWRAQVDTYEREIERYGGHAGIDLSEDIFCIDSAAVAEVLSHVSGDTGIDARWRLCIRSWDLLLTDIGLDLPQKLEVVRTGRRNCSLALGATKQTDRALGDRFRNVRKGLEQLFDTDEQPGHALMAPLSVLGRRSNELAPVMRNLRKNAHEGLLTVPLSTISLSYLHLNAIRTLRSSHRKQELVMYDFLARIYESEIARARSGRVARRSATSTGNIEEH